MRLKNKTLTGVVQPLSYVDKMLRQQGFHRSGGDSMPTYDVVMYDSASSSAYFCASLRTTPAQQPEKGN